MKSRLVLLFIGFILSSFCLLGFTPNNETENNSPASNPVNGKYRGAEVITTAQLKDYLSFIAADELEGRDTPSRGLNTAAKFIATYLSRWGLKPAGDNGTYFQRLALLKTTVDSAQSFLEINGQRFRFGADFIVNTNAGAGTASGPLIYVSHGSIFPQKNIDAFQGLDVKGKIVVWTNEFSKGASNAAFFGKEGVDWVDPIKYVAQNGALGVISIARFQTLTYWEQTQKHSMKTGGLVVEKFQAAGAPKIPMIWLSPKAATALFRGEQENANRVFNSAAAGEPVAAFEFAAEKQVTFTVMMKTEKLYTQNVVGVLEGSDGGLKKEYVALGAHYDHDGVGNPVNGDAIYNGADDDGSGTVSILAIAEAFAKGVRPKRSLLFVWHTGEEKGLWGSKYFTEYPTVPIDKIVAQLNIDMIGRSKKAGDTNPRNGELTGPNEIYVVGSKMMSTALGALSESVNKSFYNLSFNYKYDDPNDPNRFFFRSDHFHYAQKGIPIIFYFNGEHEDYHKVTDQVEKIDFEKMQRVARTVYAMAWELASGMKRPAVDKKLPPELTNKP
jgi:Zn-dependent M28 family amino/carboxypeptidase